MKKDIAKHIVDVISSRLPDYVKVVESKEEEIESKKQCKKEETQDSQKEQQPQEQQTQNNKQQPNKIIINGMLDITASERNGLRNNRNRKQGNIRKSSNGSLEL